jgi:hypothetical protein
MIDLLQQARINFVWITYSAGFSEQDEDRNGNFALKAQIGEQATVGQAE